MKFPSLFINGNSIRDINGWKDKKRRKIPIMRRQNNKKQTIDGRICQAIPLMGHILMVEKLISSGVGLFMAD